MAIDPSLSGRSFPPTEPYDVSQEKIVEFAAATGSAYDEHAAPVTFPIVVAFGVMQSLMADPEVGIELQRVVHGEQRFAYARPVVAGDQLSATLTVETLRQIGGADIIGTRTEIVDRDGLPVCTAYATLVHRGGA